MVNFAGQFNSSLRLVQLKIKLQKVMIDIQQFGQISATEKSNAHVYSKEHVIIIHR